MTHSAPLLLIHVLFLSLLPLTITSSPTIEAECLLKWKNSLISSLSLNSSWSLTNIGNLCNWTGIACDTTGSVSEINLSETELEGTLAKFDFSSFPGLTDFNLGTNKLNGSIPSMVANPSNLIFLDLSNNIFFFFLWQHHFRDWRVDRASVAQLLQQLSRWYHPLPDY